MFSVIVTDGRTFPFRVFCDSSYRCVFACVCSASSDDGSVYRDIARHQLPVDMHDMTYWLAMSW